MPRYRRFLLAWIALSACCSSPKRESHIFGSMPQVYARERLVTERVRELQWLNKRLEQPFEQGLQGRFGSASVDRARFAAGANVRQALQTGGIPAVSNAALDATLADPFALSGDGLGLSPIQQLRAEESYRGEVLSSIRRMSLDDAHDLHGRRMVEFTLNVGVVPEPDESRFALVTVKLCKKAAEQGVKSGEDKSGGNDGTYTIDELRRPIENRLRELQESYQEELKNELNYVFASLLETDDRRQAQGQFRLEDLGTEDGIQALEMRLEGFADPFGIISPTDDSSPPNDVKIQLATEAATDWWHRRRMEDATPPKIEDLQLARAASFLSTELKILNDARVGWSLKPAEGAATSPQLELSLRTLPVKELGADHDPTYRITEVEPGESSQVWDIAAVRDVQRELSLGVSFGDNTVGLSSALDRLQRSLSSSRAPTQIPDIVGFGSSPSHASWLLCPTHIPDGSKSNRRVHRPKRHNLTLRAVVPVDAKVVLVDATYRWVGRDGVPDGSAIPLFGGQLGTDSEKTHLPATCTEVVIPPDIPKIADTIIYSADSLRTPSIRTHQGELREGVKNQTILIQGRELWRSPQVFLGGRQASRVELLPDMGGLVATFDEVRVPTPKETSAQEVGLPLSVITSTGKSRARYSVTVYRDTRPAEFAKLEDDPAKPIIEKGSISFAIDPLQAPRAFNNVVLTLRRDPGSPHQHFSVPRKVIFPGGSPKWQFEVGSDAFKKVLGQAPGRAEVGLLLVPEPGADAQRIPMPSGASKYVTWFPNVSATRPKWSESELVFNGSSLTKKGAAITSLTIQWPSSHARTFQLARLHSGKKVLWQDADDLELRISIGSRQILVPMTAAKANGGIKTLGTVGLAELTKQLQGITDLAPSSKLKGELLSGGKTLELGTELTVKRSTPK